MSISAVVLAGGQGRRLGMDKALLPVKGQPLLARIVDILAAVSDDLIVVTNRPATYLPLGLPVRLVTDVRPGEGALMGVYSGLTAACGLHAVVVGCDMPLLSLPLLRMMIDLAEGYDVVIPRLGENLEPLHAVYGRGCLEPMRRALDGGKRQIIAFFPEVRVRYVDAGEIDAVDPLRYSFLNVNTPEDWKMIQRLLL